MGDSSRKKREVIILILLLLLTIVIRLPTTNHLVYTDSYVNLWISKRIIQASAIPQHILEEWNGKPKKFGLDLSNPLNAFNSLQDLKEIYPFTTPVLYNLAVVNLSLVTGISLEISALILSLFFGGLGVLGSYIMARELTESNPIRYLTVFFYSTAPVYVSISSFTFLSRNPVVSLLPIFFWFLLRLQRVGNKVYLTLIFINGLFLILVHRIGVIVLLLITSYILSLFIQGSLKKSGRLSHKLRLTLPYVFTILPLILMLIPIIVGDGFYSEALWKYKWGYFFTGAKKSVIFANMLVDYYSSLGILGIIGLVGFIQHSSKLREPTFNGLFLSSSILFLAPFMVFGEYVNILVLPFYSYFTAYGLKKIVVCLKPYLKSTIPLIIFGLIVVSVFFTQYMCQHWISTTTKPFYTTNQWIEDPLTSMAEYVNKIPGIILAPIYFNTLEPYITPYLDHDERLLYTSDYWRLNPLFELRVTHRIESPGIRTLWTPLFGKPPGERLNTSNVNEDIVYSNGLIEVLAMQSPVASMIKSDVTLAFNDLEIIVGLTNGQLLVYSTGGILITPLVRNFPLPITTIKSKDITERALKDLVLTFSDGSMIVLDNAGRIVNISEEEKVLLNST
ncbi:MAG: hypothetical protein ABH851_07545 [Methanobacteriota archaeon]